TLIGVAMGYVFQSEEQKLAVEGLQRFLRAEVEPVFNKEYRDRPMPKEKMAEFMAKLSEYGLVSGLIGEAHGGMGADWLTNVMLSEEVAAVSLDTSTPVLITSFGAYTLEHAAPDHLRERYLPGLVKGETFVSMGISDPGAGSNVAEVRPRARRDGDHYVI